ncbi:hypothetical protein [Streptomyces acidiscabies]|uniref:Uncharacterized protein n=1 Tax=Streptomyces acidiscabies TaxID=42234 RepID=A0ABU4LW24_9ACTN|nr:hypothetical protein [Streptomyces acidiscabies]MDX3019915.1 hypothetical protein [Streptomyces acidiscabies]
MSAREETLAEVVTWLTKKAREFRSNGEHRSADTASVLASKVARGAVRPNNLRMPPPDFFEPGHTYRASAWEFRCDALTRHPETGERTALGWLRVGSSDWTTWAYSAADWGPEWTDTTAEDKA